MQNAGYDEMTPVATSQKVQRKLSLGQQQHQYLMIETCRRQRADSPGLHEAVNMVTQALGC